MQPHRHRDLAVRLADNDADVLREDELDAKHCDLSVDGFCEPHACAAHELQRVMERSFDAVNAKADEADCDYRTAAYTIAISRVAEACRLKGLFP